MSDLISKSDVLARLKQRNLGHLNWDNEDYESGLSDGNKAAIETIEAMPCSDDKLVEALERCIKIVEVNNWRQAEKVDDVIHVARAAIDNHAKSILKDKGAR